MIKTSDAEAQGERERESTRRKEGGKRIAANRHTVRKAIINSFMFFEALQVLAVET